MSREPLLLPAVALTAGILCAHFYYFRPLDLAIPAILAAVGLSLTFFSDPGAQFRPVTVCVAMALVGIGTQASHRQDTTPRLNAEDAEIVLLDGCVTNPPVFSPAREQFTLSLTPSAAARITMNLKDGNTLALDYGQQVEVAAKVRSPRNYGNPHGFDYAGYLAEQHIYWNGSVSSPADIRILPGRCRSSAISWLYGVRAWALARLHTLYGEDPHTAALLAATLLGETSGVERRWTSDFRVTGTYHALVISGQHVSVLAFTLLLILRLMRVRRVPALCVATAASWLYAFISGFSSPVVRAAGGFTLFLIASYFFRKTRILNILAAIGIAYLIFDPNQLFDPSFQLSFLSAAAIAVFAIPLMERFTEPVRASVKRFDQTGYDPLIEDPRAAQWRVEFRLLAGTLQAWSGLPHSWVHFGVTSSVWVAAFVAEAIAISLCVQFGLALPMVSYFHRLSVTGLSANIVVIPLLSLVVPLGFASIATGWSALAKLTRVLLEMAEWVAGWHVQFEPSWRMGAVPLAASVGFAASLFLLAVAIRLKSRWMLPALGCALASFLIICWQPWRAQLSPHMLELTAIDVSQGDSLFVAFPNGQTMLVDAGGFAGMSRMARKPQIDVGEDVVSPYLWSRRIRHLDYAVLTHGHSDHMDGLAAVLDNFRPRILWIGAEPDSAEWAKVKQHAKLDGVRIVPLTRASAEMEIGGAHMRVLAPAADYVSGESANNNDSLVLEISYKHRSVLLTGDAERPVEDDLVNSGALRRVTLLKVGHHGSRTSSSQEFLDQVQPQLAFISDGYKNQFRHPNADVLDRLTAHHTAVFRTDQHGLLTFRTDGEKFELETFR